MVLMKTLDRRWFRHYRTFIIIGGTIFLFQLYLAIKFLSIHNDTVESNKWNPYKIIIDSEFENNVNSARRLKDGFIIDDEDSISYTYIAQNFKKTNKEISTQKYKNQTFLRVEELDFVPSCEINSKEAISAIHRAKTQKCKQLLVNITCLAKQGVLYPKTLPNYCPSVPGHSLGCFKDDKTYRLLSGYYANFKTNNAPNVCIQMCLQSGFPYAGVQYSTECFCGNNEPPSTARLPDSSCNMKCPANPHLACGGYFTINIYQTGITKFSPQIAQFPSKKETNSVRIVFLLTLNGRASRQIIRLIKILYHKNNYFYIHVDSRQDYLFREMLLLEQKFSNIRVARRRFSTIWGGASLLEMLLASMQELLSSDWKWDFVINLSESDFPVKTVNQLVDFLSANKDKNFVKSHGREVQRFIQKQGLDKTFVECDAHMWRQGDRQLPWGIQIDGGSDWVALSRPFVSYVSSKSPDKLVEGLITVFKYSLLPAESFFHTVLRNSKFCNTYVDNNLHVTNWKRKLGCRCQYKHVVDWCGCSPNDFRSDDWLRIQGTENKQLFFARKFEPIISQSIILQVEEWMYGPAPLNIKNLHSYWQNIYHYADLSPPVDDAVFTIATSITRLVSKNLAKNNCALKSSRVLELTSYHKNDNYQGTLILHESTLNDKDTVQLETFIKPIENMRVFKESSSSLVQRLLTFVVSSEYDQKEQTFRNFARILGPFTDISMVYEFAPSLTNSAKIQNVTFLWVDSAGQLIEISEITVDETHVLGYIKPQLKQPLLPGAWTVKMIHRKQVIANCDFLITPLEFMSNMPLSQTQSVFVHSGSINKEFDSKWNHFLKSEAVKESLFRKALSNAKRFGFDLSEWIDSLTDKFYTIKHTCSISKKLHCNNIIFPQCNLTEWSSFSEDPKSSIQRINETSEYVDQFW